MAVTAMQKLQWCLLVVKVKSYKISYTLRVHPAAQFFVVGWFSGTLARRIHESGPYGQGGMPFFFVFQRGNARLFPSEIEEILDQKSSRI